MVSPTTKVDRADMLTNKPLLPPTSATYLAPLSALSSPTSDSDSPTSVSSASTTISNGSSFISNGCWAHSRQQSTGSTTSSNGTSLPPSTNSAVLYIPASSTSTIPTSRHLPQTSLQQSLSSSPAGLDPMQYVHTAIPVSLSAVPSIVDPLALDSFRLLAASAAPQYSQYVSLPHQPMVIDPLQQAYYNEFQRQTSLNIPRYPQSYATLPLPSQQLVVPTLPPQTMPSTLPAALQTAVPIVADVTDSLGTLRRQSLISQATTLCPTAAFQYAQIPVTTDGTLSGSIQPQTISASTPSMLLQAQLAAARSDPWKLRVGQLEAELRRAREEVDERSALLESMHTHTNGSITRDADPQETIEALRMEVTTAMLEFARDSADMRERLRMAEKSKSGDPHAMSKLEGKVAELERRLGDGTPTVPDAGQDGIEELRARLTDIEGVLAVTQEELANSIHLKEVYDRTTTQQVIRIRQMEEKCSLLQNLCKELEGRVRDQDSELNRVRSMSVNPLVDTMASPNSASATDETAGMDRALVALQFAEQRIAKLDDEVSKLTTKSQEHELAHLTANHELEQLRGAHEIEKAAAAKKIQELEQSRVASIKAYELRVKQYGEENAKLQSRVNILEADLKRTLHELHKATDESGLLSAGYNSVRGELETLRELLTKTPAAAISEGELVALRSENTKLKKHKADLEAHSQQALQVYNEMVTLIEERDGQIEQLEKLLEGYQKAGLPLTDGTTADPSATEKIISELADSRSKLTSLEAQNDVLTSMLSQQREQHNDEVHKLRSDLDAAERKSSEALVRLEALKSGNGSGSLSLPELENIVTNLRIALQDKSEDANQLKSLLSTLNYELLAKDKTMNDMLRYVRAEHDERPNCLSSSGHKNTPTKRMVDEGGTSQGGSNKSRKTRKNTRRREKRRKSDLRSSGPSVVVGLM
ncbi:hypothetical protein SeLEV6574_g03538 [Synchytrium endobioticum]|nr:hypothetical protein SeLEV6574_g03538 [Synchytrium endobioticum]